MSYVYVIGADFNSPVKIGVASDVSKRLERLQSGNPVTLSVLWQSAPLADAYSLERYMHKHYAEYSVRGEWFSIPNLATVSLEMVASTFEADTEATTKRLPTAIAASAAAKCLVDHVVRTKGVSVRTAISAVASWSNLENGEVWSLLYRKTRDVYADVYVNIARELWRVSGLPAKRSPSPEEVLAEVDAMQVRELTLPIEPNHTDTERD